MHSFVSTKLSVASFRLMMAIHCSVTTFFYYGSIFFKGHANFLSHHSRISNYEKTAVDCDETSIFTDILKIPAEALYFR